MNRLSLLAITAILVYLSLVPWNFDFSQPFHHPVWQTPRTPGDYVDSVLNVLVYIPLGFAALRTLGSFWGAVLFGTLLSLAIEYLQVFLVVRDSSWRDVLFNGLGTLMGCAAARLPIATPALPRLPAAGMFCAALWFTAHCFPFLPVLRRSSLFKLQNTLASVQWDSGAALDATAAALILCLLLPRAIAALALFVPLLIEPLILGQQVQPMAFAGALAGYVLACVLPPAPLALLVFGLIALRQLQPFHWSADTKLFHWMPFAAVADLPPVVYLRILVFKLMLYTGALLLARRARVRLSLAAVTLAALLAVSEALQTHLPGRTPESTDLLLVILGAIATWRLSGRQSAS